MTMGVGRCRMGLALVALSLTAFLAGGASARRVADGVGPVESPLGIERGPGNIDVLSPVELWERTYTHLKVLGMPAEEIPALLDELQARAFAGEVAEDLIERATWLVDEKPSAEKAGKVLRRHAEILVYGGPLDAAPNAAPIQMMLPGSIERRVFASDESEPPMQQKSFEPDDSENVFEGEIVDPAIPAAACSVTCLGSNFGPFVPGCVAATHSSLLPVSGDCLQYTFTLTGGQTYSFDTCLSGGPASGQITNLSLRNSSCTVVASGATALCGAATCGRKILNYLVPGVGPQTHYLQVSRSGFACGATTAAYTLRYQKTSGCPVPCAESCALPGGSLPAVDPGTPCQCVSGTTFDPATGGCHSRFYSVSLASGKSYHFSACAAASCSPTAAANFDAVLRLYAPGGCMAAPVAENDDFGGPCGTKPAFDYQVSGMGGGTYILEVTGPTSGDFGDFTVCYSENVCLTCLDPTPGGVLTPTGACQQTPLRCVAPCAGTSREFHLFSLVAGQSYSFATKPAGPPCNPACGGTHDVALDTILEIYDPMCNKLTDNDDCTPGTTGSVIPAFVAPVTGVYKVAMTPFGSTTGCYRIGYRFGCTPPSSVSVTPSAAALTTAVGTCSASQVFLVGVDAGATTPVTFSYLVTSVGGSAMPSAGVLPPGVNTFPVTFTKNPCGTASFNVTVTAANSCGSVSRTATVTLVDDKPPTVIPPANTVADCNSIPPPGAATAIDNCDPMPVASFVSETVVPGPDPDCGNYTLLRRYRATDCNGNTSPLATQVIVVLDTTPPTVTFSDETIACLWSPNHDYLCVDLSSLPFTVTDDCSAVASVSLAGVMSSECDNGPCDSAEGNGDGNFEQDICPVPAELIGQSSFCVRAERQGSGVGRYYTVFVIAADGCGNPSAPISVGKIFVPHDDSEHPECIPADEGKICAEAVCDNGIDGDGDGLIDCADPDCAGQPGC